ncbi:hypothetical protein GCM10007939_08560 [Amylibacter marinus]|uniref:Cell wall hydrolase SleB domain-containing protein n=1 Tax=Amylibacter marinus TaxID=1475483 RepID=A0ABQ5VTX4_9RHOB|nr:cell wall hydrolase [Amylibacter marinus]GLQ34573.1 hypothetical protein GCM10007939_08560 [Amylibacter marinus]
MKYLNVIALCSALIIPVAANANTASYTLAQLNAVAQAEAKDQATSGSTRTGRWVPISEQLSVNMPINKTIDGQPREKGNVAALSARDLRMPLYSKDALPSQEEADAFGNLTITNVKFAPKNQKRKIGSLFQRRPKVHIYATVPAKATINALPQASGDAEWACLTEALYFEARGESLSGIFAVAEVIVNRRNSKKFPNTVCKVISQGAHRRNACQFSYKCDGHKEIYHEKKAKELVAKIAQIVLEQRAPKLTSGATFYHAKSVSPRWSRAFDRTATIGHHHFYRG